MGYINFTALCFFSFLVIINSQVDKDLLEFTPVDGASNEKNVYLTDVSPEVLIDATSKVPRSVYFLGSSVLVTSVVRFACAVSSPLTDLKLCCGNSGPNFVCSRLIGKEPTGKITCNRIQFDYTFDRLRGANFSLSFEPKRKSDFPIDGQLYCEAQDSDIAIESNVITLHDAFFYYNKLGVSSSNDVEKVQPAEISPQDFPLKFSCGDYAKKLRDWPSWMTAVWQGHLFPFEWRYCQVGSSITPVGCVQNGKRLGLGDGVVAMDGTLFLLSDTVMAKNPNIAFVCLKRGSDVDPIRVFASEFESRTTPTITKGLTLDRNARPSQLNGFEAISPLETIYQLIEWTDLVDFYLHAFYRTPYSATPLQIKTVWSKDGTELTGPEVTATSFRLPSRVERGLAGIYALRVTENDVQQLRFIFNVSIIGPPTFKDINCIDDLFYALEDSTRQIYCSLEARKNDNVTFRVGVNEFEAESAEQLKKEIASSLQLQNQPIARLDINFWNSDGGLGMTVDVKSLTVGQNFRLYVKAINEYGQSMVAGTIRVVPKPVLEVAPSRMSCDADCNEEPFDVKCNPTTDVLRQWSHLKIVSHQGWVLERTFTMNVIIEDADLSKYFVYNPANPSTLRVSPVRPLASFSASTSSTSMETLQNILSTRLSRPLNSLRLECRFELFVNNSKAKFDPYSSDSMAGSGTGRKRREAIDEQLIIYDTYNAKDETLKRLLTVHRTFSEVVRPAVSSFAWVAAVIIAIIFILVVLIVGIWLCTRNRGETYKLSKKEYKSGNDPLRELKEKEAFKTYERPEEPPSLVCAAEDLDVEVESDQEGELEAYNMDPSTFNEEASFIGLYGSPSRTSGYREHQSVV